MKVHRIQNVFEGRGIGVSEGTITRSLKDMNALYARAILEYSETVRDEIVKERTEFARRFINDVRA